MHITIGNHPLCQWSVIGMLIMCSVWVPTIANAQQTAPPSEGIITNKVEDLVGIWEGVFKGTMAYRQFDADGTFKCALEKAEQLQESASLVYSGRFWFEGGLLKITETLMPKTGTYRVRVKKRDGKSVHLSFEDMGDPDSIRAHDWGKGMSRLER
jgi:hypothetical protein